MQRDYQDNRIVNKAAYSVLGIGEHESAKFWLGVCNDLKNRGVEDILIACKDGLSGFSEAINTVFPKTEIQMAFVLNLLTNKPENSEALCQLHKWIAELPSYIKALFAPQG